MGLCLAGLALSHSRSSHSWGLSGRRNSKRGEVLCGSLHPSSVTMVCSPIYVLFKQNFNIPLKASLTHNLFLLKTVLSSHSGCLKMNMYSFNSKPSQHTLL